MGLEARDRVGGPQAMPPDLSVRSLRKEYPHPAGALVVLNELSLEMSLGEALAIMGPSGSGKSTLLYILGSLETPSDGAVEVCGRNPFALDPAGLAAFRNKTIGFVLQDHHLLPQCTSLENVLLPTLPAGGATPELVGRGEQLLARVGLAERMDRLPSELSGGERQRVAIARALLRNSPVLILDEATSSLDAESERLVQDALARLMLNRTAFVIAHRLSTVRRADRIVVLDRGRVRETGRHEELLSAADGLYAKLCSLQLLGVRGETPRRTETRS